MSSSRGKRSRETFTTTTTDPHPDTQVEQVDQQRPEEPKEQVEPAEPPKESEEKPTKKTKYSDDENDRSNDREAVCTIKRLILVSVVVTSSVGMFFTSHDVDTKNVHCFKHMYRYRPIIWVIPT